MVLARSAVHAKAVAHSLIKYSGHALHKGPVELWILCGGLVAIVEDQGQIYGHALLHIYGTLYWRCTNAARHCDASLAYSRSLCAASSGATIASDVICFD